MAGLRPYLWRAAVLLFAITAMHAFAQSRDSHLSVDPAAPIYQRSIFMHGYAHGYELGFHSGDLDLHMGRSSRDPRSLKMFKDGKKAYDKRFGDRDMFLNGYEQGFRVAYADAFNGREFRAAQEARTLSQQLQDDAPMLVNGKPDRSTSEFDKGISEGYKRGLANGLNDGRVNNAFRPEQWECSRKATAGAYCPANRLGYELGYSDGYNNQRKPEQSIKTASE